MRGKGEEIDIHCVHVYGDMTEGLNSVRVERDIVFLCDVPDFCYGLKGSNLVVRMHGTDENCVPGNSPADIIRIHKSFSVDRNDRDADPQRLHIFKGMEHGMVLDSCCDDMGSLCSQRDPLDGSIVGLRDAACEYDLPGVRSDKIRHLFPCSFHSFPGFHSEAVCGGRVAEFLCKVRLHEPRNS